jgi:hypothetical protein
MTYYVIEDKIYNYCKIADALKGLFPSEDVFLVTQEGESKKDTATATDIDYPSPDSAGEFDAFVVKLKATMHNVLKTASSISVLIDLALSDRENDYRNKFEKRYHSAPTAIKIIEALCGEFSAEQISIYVISLTPGYQHTWKNVLSKLNNDMLKRLEFVSTSLFYNPSEGYENIKKTLGRAE